MARENLTLGGKCRREHRGWIAWRRVEQRESGDDMRHPVINVVFIVLCPEEDVVIVFLADAHREATVNFGCGFLAGDNTREEKRGEKRRERSIEFSHRTVG